MKVSQNGGNTRHHGVRQQHLGRRRNALGHCAGRRRGILDQRQNRRAQGVQMLQGTSGGAERHPLAIEFMPAKWAGEVESAEILHAVNRSPMRNRRILAERQASPAMLGSALWPEPHNCTDRPK